jgi:hypothetical protein
VHQVGFIARGFQCVKTNLGRFDPEEDVRHPTPSKLPLPLYIGMLDPSSMPLYDRHKNFTDVCMCENIIPTCSAQNCYPTQPITRSLQVFRDAKHKNIIA